MRAVRSWCAALFGPRRGSKVGVSRRVLLLGLGLSFVFPFFWWTFFYVSTVSGEALSRPTAASLVLVIGVALFALGFMMGGSRVTAWLDRAPWAAVGIVCAAAVSVILLRLSADRLIDLPGAVCAALALSDALGVSLMLQMWGAELARGDLRLKDYAMAFSGAAFLFFGYVLLFIGIPGYRFLLSLGAVPSSIVWIVLRRADGARASAGDEQRTAFSSPAEWASLVVAYVALSVEYWLLFSYSQADAFPAGSFEWLGSSPIGNGQPPLYAMFLLFLALLFIGFLSLKPIRYKSFLIVVQGALAAVALLASFGMVYLLPGHADVAEAVNCLIRADVQMTLFAVCFFMAASLGRTLPVLVVPVVDALTLLATSLLLGGSGLPLEIVAANIQNVSFVCGGVIALCLAGALVAYSGKSQRESKAERDEERVLSYLCAEHGLSEREREVLSLAARGYGAKGIAETLSIAPSTAQTHISRIYTKTGVHSKQELITFVEDAKASLARRE